MLQRYGDINQATFEQGCLHVNFVDSKESKNSQTF